MARRGGRKLSDYFVWAILILLMVGLAGFGIGNFGGSATQVGSVGNASISANAYARAIQAEFKPDVVLGMGGYASGPGGIAAWLRRTPLVLHEQNAVAGAVDRAIRTLQSNAYEPVVVLTGGDASRILNALSESPLHRPHLVLQGLAHMLDHAR